jgi:putative photosynthetic complex assembly protein 2
MIDYGLPLLVAVFVWWASTGAILYLDGLPRSTFKWSFAGIWAIGLLAIAILVSTAGETTASSAMWAFTGGVLVWAVPTAAFYFGFVTGPRRTPMPADLRGVARFRVAAETMLHHEALCAAGAVVVAAVVWSAPNQVGLWTYLILWAMHLSGKLNVFLGVRNLAEEFIPPHLQYLTSYMRRAPMNLLFPLTVTAATVLMVALLWPLTSNAVTPFETSRAIVLGVIAALAVLEHWLLVLPLPSMALWTWSLASRATPPLPPGLVPIDGTRPPD